MFLENIPFEDTHQFSPLFLDYISKKESLFPFYQYSPNIENFKKLIENKTFSKDKRILLQKVLEGQYKNISTSSEVAGNIQLISEPGTFTITTGHQLNIFSGPLFFIYKIAATIILTKKLKKQYPEYNFVPVYWMATEDHDFEEISHFRLFGKEYRWESDQSGPVGRMSPHSLREVLNQIPEKLPLFEKAYLEHDTLTDATRYFVNELFGEYGLVTIDGDDHFLKKELIPVINEDILHHRSNELVEQTSEKLTSLGYKTQVYSRKINLFYMEDGLRKRIVREDNTYKVLETELEFDESGILDMVEKHPERFSPNVILRPLYQEIILPNLAYIGGPAEVAYWLQLKCIFDHHACDFPILLPRIFALYVNKTLTGKIRKLGMKSKDLFSDEQTLKETYILENGSDDHLLDEEFALLTNLFESVLNKTHTIDQSLKGMVGKEHKQAEKSLLNIQKRLKKAQEARFETSLNQIRSVREKLRPDNKLQERTDNFLNIFINNPEFIHEVINTLDPLDFRFNLIFEDA